MKTRFLMLAGLLAALMILSACAPAAPALAKPEATAAKTSNAAPTPNSTTEAKIDPIQVVKDYVETANSGDFNKTLAFYAEDAVVENGLGLFVGKDQIAKWLENDVKTTQSSPKEWAIQGGMVVVSGQVSLSRFQQAGIGMVDFNAEYMVDQNGKIRFFAPIVTLTPDQQKIMQALQAKAPPVPTPEMDPLNIAKAYVETANSGNFEKALAFYADDSAALVVNGTLLLSGKQKIADWLKDDIQTTRAVPQNWKVTGSTVVNTGTVSLARFKKLGIDSVQYSAEYVIENGQIRFFRPTLSLTPEQQKIIQAAQSNQSP